MEPHVAVSQVRYYSACGAKLVSLNPLGRPNLRMSQRNDVSALSAEFDDLISGWLVDREEILVMVRFSQPPAIASTGSSDPWKTSETG